MPPLPHSPPLPPPSAPPSLQTLLPQLAERADEEAAWLDKQDWRRLGKAGGLNGIAGAVGYGGGGASSLYAPASLAPRASASLYAQPSLAPGAQGGGGGSGVRGAVEPAAVDEVGNVLDGNTEMVPHDEDSGNGSSGASGSDAGGGQQAAAAGAQPGSGGAAPIDSPWAKVRACALPWLLLPGVLACGLLLPGAAATPSAESASPPLLHFAAGD